MSGEGISSDISVLAYTATSDYNPRLSFRDDTPRTVERMREAFLVGESVFDGEIYSTLLHATLII
jgi:hypothetical protein